MNKLAKVTIISFLVMAISCEDSEADKDPLPEFHVKDCPVNWTCMEVLRPLEKIDSCILEL